MKSHFRLSSAWISGFLAVAVLSAVTLFSAAAEAAPKYAGFVVDTTTGKVLYEQNADSLRYPASLTKMMTLYLTFEALEKGKLKLNQKLPVSAKAAKMPQTNIALKSGEKVPVDTLIRSLVVRSANDSAVVLAEGLGKTEWNFAMMMTQKARALGMKNTIFRNANGLPNPKQLSTARDLAVLGMALRRDFPQYYPYFKLESFSWNGRVYPGHNRVLGRLDGADGIKTGYTNASGFNLVTSAKQYGHNVIGVVLGGTSGRARDDQMVALMNRAFTRIAAGDVPGAVNRQFAMGNSKQGKSAVQLNEPAAAQVAQAQIDEPEQAGQGSTMRDDEPAATTAAAQTPAAGWGIQVGTYARTDEAVNAANQAVRMAAAELSTGKIAVSNDQDGKINIHRARLASLTENQAKSACRKLIQRNESCFVYRADL